MKEERKNKRYNKRNKRSKKGDQKGGVRNQEKTVQPQKPAFDELDKLYLDLRKDPYFFRFFKRIKDALQKELLAASGSKILVSVSGGVDSVCLLDALCLVSRETNYEIACAHYNHKLRGEDSDKDEIYVKKLASRYGVKFYLGGGKVRQHAEKNSLSIETAARNLRYIFLDRINKQIGADYVATAHTADDNAETFFINLFRGSGLTGLSGIPKKRLHGSNMSLLRPFINLNKSELVEYAEKRGLKWREDESNQSEDFTRNKIRLKLIPALRREFSPSIVKIINRAASLIEGADEFVQDFVRNKLDEVIDEKNSDNIYVNIPKLKTHVEFIQGELLQAAIEKHFQSLPQTTAVIDRLLSLTNSETGAAFDLNKQIVAVKDRKHLVVSRKREPIAVDMRIQRRGEYKVNGIKLKLTKVLKKDVDFVKSSSVEFFNHAKIPTKMTLRNWRAGDLFHPLGAPGRMSVSDFLTNEKAPAIEKQNVLVLADGFDIIWVIGYRISEKYKIGDKTRTFLKAEFFK